MSDKTLKQKQQRQDKEKQAYAFYVAQGWTPEQAIGIVGNLIRESNLNTTIVGTADDKGSQGVAQWHSKRLKTLKDRYGDKWTDFRNQLEFVDWELKNTEKAAGDKLKASKGIWEAGKIVSDSYERPKVKFSGDEKRQSHVADLARKFKGVKINAEDMPYYEANYATSVAPSMNQQKETVTPTLNYFDIPKETTTFASVPDSTEKEDTTEKIDKDVAEVEQKTKEYNFLEELQKEDYSHLQPQQIAQQQALPQVDFNQQYEQVSQFIDEPLVAQSGGMVNFYKEYINSPNYKKRLITQGYTNPEQVKKDRLNNLNKITQSEVSDIGSQYYHPLNKVNIDNKELKKYNLNKETTTAHEYSHGVGSMNTGNSNFAKNLTLNNKETNFINSKNNYLNMDVSYSNKKLSEDQKADIRHNSLPSEAKADIDALRFKLKKAGLYDTGTQQFNQDILNKAKKIFSKDTMINRNFKAFDDKDLIWIMNNIAQNERDVDDTTQVAQQGLTWQEKLANKNRKPTIAEIISEGDARKTQQRVQVDNTFVQKPKSNKKEFENIILDDIELAKTMEIKNPRAEANKLEKFLPNKETVDFFKKVKDEAGADYFTALLKIQSERGNPKINVGTDKGLPFSARRNYNPFTNEVNIPKGLMSEDDIVNYIQEVSHAGQPLIEVAGKFLTNDIPSYIKARVSKGDYADNVKKYVYDNPNNLEFYTHNILQPKLMNQVENFSAFDYQNMENKQQGGGYSENELAFLSEIAIKDNNGYWDKNNQGKVVEIQGGNISMENVDQDLIGIGINKKGKKTEQKTMKAGKSYNFDKAVKVIEIPFFKK